MTTQQSFSEHVGHLDASVGVFNDHLKASVQETSQQLRVRADLLRSDVKVGAAEIGEDMKATTKWIGQRAAGLRGAVGTARVETTHVRRVIDDGNESDSEIIDIWYRLGTDLIVVQTATASTTVARTIGASGWAQVMAPMIFRSMS